MTIWQRPLLRRGASTYGNPFFNLSTHTNADILLICSATLLKSRRKLSSRSQWEDWQTHLLKRIVAINQDDFESEYTNLHRIAAKGTLEDVRHELELHRWALDRLNASGYTPLMLAIEAGNNPAIEELIRGGCDVNQRDFEGKTALMRASLLGNTRAVLALLNSRAAFTVNTVDKTGLTALHYCAKASEEGSGEIINALLQAGAKACATDRVGRTAVHFLCDSRAPKELFSRKLQTLLSNGAPRTYSIRVTPALVYAIVSGNVVALECFVDAGIPFHCMGHHQLSPLHWAAFRASEEILSSLKSLSIQGLDVKQTDRNGFTAWDSFVWRLHNPTWRYGKYRKPTESETKAFVDLFLHVRQNNFNSDIGALDEIKEYLRLQDTAASLLGLDKLVKLERKRRQLQQLETYRAVQLQIRQGMWEAAIESVEEVIEVLKAQVTASPWSCAARCCISGRCEINQNHESEG